jgi:alpha-methylacyl-CoA racemase
VTKGPLSGVRVIEVAGIGPAPFACMLLADLGAEVLRLERSSGTLSTIMGRFDVLARGRRSVAIDMTGWGQDGPLAARVGHDIDYAAVAGAISTVGEPGRKPVPPLNLVADFGGGSMFCVTGVLAALVERATSGKGQVIDVAMVDGVSSLLAMAHSQRSAGMMNDERGSNLLDGGTPYYDTYRCADGEYMAVGAIEPQFFNELARVVDILGLPAQSDIAEWPRMRELLIEKFATRTRAEWIEAFDGVDACVSPVWRMSEAVADPHIAARQSLLDIEGVIQPNVAPRFSRTPGEVGAAPKPVGTDTTAALRDWGIKDEAIDQLLADSVVTQA